MAARFASAAANDLACPICFHFYVTPHEPKNVTNCSHIYCSLCLKKLEEGGLKTIKCPQCNKISNLPDEGVDGLITSLIVRNLAENHPEGIKQRKEQMQVVFETQKKQKTDLLTEAEEAINRIRTSMEQEEKEIQKVVECVMTQAEDATRQIGALGQTKLSQVQQTITQLKQQIEDIERSETKLERMTTGKFQTQTDALVQQMKRLRVNEPDSVRKGHSAGKFVAHEAKLGRIVKPRRLELVHEFGEFSRTSSVMSKPNGILAVCDSEFSIARVFVFKYENERYKNKFQFQIELVEPVEPYPMIAMAISAEGEYLIAERGATGFGVYSPTGKRQRTVKVRGKSNQDLQIVSIAPCKDGMILVGSGTNVKEYDMFNEFFITIHDAAGSFVGKIPTRLLGTNIVNVGGTHVAVGNCMCDEVCVYDLETGKETLTFDISMSCGICYDEGSDYLLVARIGTDEDIDPDDTRRIIPSFCVLEQYCCITGKKVATLAREIEARQGMTITHEGMLAIVDSKTVKVYTLD